MLYFTFVASVCPEGGPKMHKNDCRSKRKLSKPRNPWIGKTSQQEQNTSNSPYYLCYSCHCNFQIRSTKFSNKAATPQISTQFGIIGVKITESPRPK